MDRPSQTACRRTRSRVLRIVDRAALHRARHDEALRLPGVGDVAGRCCSLFWLAGVLEVVGGVLLLLGLFTRPVAFLLAGEMAVAYWMAHAPQSFFPVLNGGDVRDPLLLRLPLPGLRRPRRLEPRRPPRRGACGRADAASTAPGASA